MFIKVSELQEQGVVVDDATALATAFSDPAWRLDRIRLEVLPDGRDVVVRGDIGATVPQACGRCLETFPARVAAAVDVRLLPRPATSDTVKLGADDLDVDFYADDQLDLDRVVETETTLALPMKPLCRDDCRGLCPVCGTNRNVTACGCAEKTADPRWAALNNITVRPTS